jgi:hypothetical protein
VLLDADTPTRIARTGRADPDEKVGTVAASLAALYGMKEAIYENQAYSVVYATLGCTDCVQHNHGGAGTLFPAFQVQGSRPRYSDLVGTLDGETVTGSCGRINDIDLETNSPNLAQGGKFMSAPLNSEQVCAVFSGTPCGDPGRGGSMFAPSFEFLSRSPPGEPQTFGDKKSGRINGANFGQWVNQYGVPGPQMGFNGQNNLMTNQVFFAPDGARPYFNASDLETIRSQNAAFRDLPNIIFSNKYSPAGTVNREICYYDHSNGLSWIKNPPCDPRHYDVNVSEARYGCTNARVIGKKFHDYSVWPFVDASDPSGDLSSSVYSKLVPSGLFLYSDSPPNPRMTEAEFLAAASRPDGSGKAYTAIRQLYPQFGTNNVLSKNTFIANMTGYQACQCFVGPNDADGQPLAPPTSEPFDGCGIEESWNRGKDEPYYLKYACDPPNTRSDLKKKITYNCASKKGVGSCKTYLLPQSPGPVPQTKGWTKADVRDGKPIGGTKRWWTEAYNGLPSIRLGVWLYFGNGFKPVASDIFNKKLYVVSDPNMNEFRSADLARWIEVAMVNISQRTDLKMFVIDPDDESKAYVKTPKRDMCADFGRIDSTDTNWTSYTLTDELFERQTDPNSNVTFSSGSGTASTWNRLRNVSVCLGNLHGMPSFSPGVCGPVPELEEAAKTEADGSDVPCKFPPIEVPVCGNPYFNSPDPTIGTNRPRRPGNQYAHYCSPTKTNTGFAKTETASPDNLNLLQCEGDVLTVDERQTFCEEGGYIGVRGKRVVSKRPESSVCGVGTRTCLAFSGDSVWPLEKIIELANRVFIDDYTIVVVPVNATVIQNLPLEVEYEDLSVLNRFSYSKTATILPTATYPFSAEGDVLRKRSALSPALCSGLTKNLNTGDNEDPMRSLADAVAGMLMIEGKTCHQGPGLPPLECAIGNYCVPMLVTVDGRGMSECISEDQMFPPVADASITIDRKNVNVYPSSVFSRKIRFGLISGSPPATCTRINVKAAGFTTRGLDFDQSNCGSLPEALRVAIVYAGNSAVDSSIRDVVVRGVPGAGVAYTGNRADGNAPFLTVGPSKLVDGADAVLAGLTFAVSETGGSLQGIVAASARTLGTQIVTQCSVEGCAEIRPVLDSSCVVNRFCSMSGCPYSRETQPCSAIETECPTYCAYHVDSGGSIGCTYGRLNASTPSRFDTNESFGITTARGIAVLRGEFNERCLENVYPFNFSQCDPNAQLQQWFVQYVPETRSHRINPGGRPFSCFVAVGEESGIVPCDGCDVSTEETRRPCESTRPYEKVVFEEKQNVPNSVFVPVSYSNETLGVVAFANGSCALKGGGVWDDCRTECIAVNKTGVCKTVKFSGGLLAACGHDGSLAAIQGRCVADSITPIDVVQVPPPAVTATAICVGGQYVLVSHGLGYSDGAAFIDNGRVAVWTSTAIVQPYDETMTISGTGVSILNLSALTGLFDRKFEARLAGADRTTTWYLLGAVIAFAVGIIVTTVACFRLFKPPPATQ